MASTLTEKTVKKTKQSAKQRAEKEGKETTSQTTRTKRKKELSGEKKKEEDLGRETLAMMEVTTGIDGIPTELVMESGKKRRKEDFEFLYKISKREMESKEKWSKVREDNLTRREEKRYIARMNQEKKEEERKQKRREKELEKKR